MELIKAATTIANLLRRPSIVLILVTADTCIGNAELGRQIRARNTKAVVPPVIDAHVSATDHMTVHAGRACTND